MTIKRCVVFRVNTQFILAVTGGKRMDVVKQGDCQECKVSK